MNERAMFIKRFRQEMITTRKLIKTQRKKIELRMKANIVLQSSVTEKMIKQAIKDLQALPPSTPAAGIPDPSTPGSLDEQKEQDEEEAPYLEQEKSPERQVKERSPRLEQEKSPERQVKERSPCSEQEESPERQVRERSPCLEQEEAPEKQTQERSPTPEKERSPDPIKELMPDEDLGPRSPSTEPPPSRETSSEPGLVPPTPPPTDGTNSSHSRSPSRSTTRSISSRVRTEVRGPRTPAKRKRSRSQTSPRRQRTRSPKSKGRKKGPPSAPSSSWNRQPARRGRGKSPKRRQTSHKYTPKHTSKRERSRSRETRTSKDVKAPQTLVSRMDVLQIMEPNDGTSLWDTRLIEEFLEAHRKADTIEDFIVFTKESAPPRWFQCAIRHNYPREKIMAAVSIIFQGTITKKTPILNILGRVSQSEWRVYKNDNYKKTGRDPKKPIHIH